MLIICWILSTIIATIIGVLVLSPVDRSLYTILSIGVPVAILGAILYSAMGAKKFRDKRRET